MAIILVTQFNSFYSAFLILSAVAMSTVGVLLGLIVPASIDPATTLQIENQLQ